MYNDAGDCFVTRLEPRGKCIMNDEHFLCHPKKKTMCVEERSDFNGTTEK